MFNLMLVFLLALIIVLTAMFVYTKYHAKKLQETKSEAATEREFMKAEKKRENARKIEETGYSERDERGYEDEDSDDSDDGE